MPLLLSLFLAGTAAVAGTAADPSAPPATAAASAPPASAAAGADGSPSAYDTPEVTLTRTDAPASNGVTEGLLANAVWDHAPPVIQARLDLANARAGLTQAVLFPNPAVTATWGTIPLGHRNDGGTGQNVGFFDVPNYTLAVSSLVELGKRGPRRDVATADVEASTRAVLAAYRAAYYDVLGAVTEEAAAVARGAVLEMLVADGGEAVRIEQQRVSKGDSAALDAERLEVEHSRLMSQRDDARADAERAHAACVAIIGPSCPPVTSAEAARAILDAITVPAPEDDGASIEHRADVQALEAVQRRGEANAVLAERLSIPDPVVSLGYTHDTFLISGNQANSLTLSVAVPLPVFDHGQAAAARAAAEQSNAKMAREAISASATGQIASARRALQLTRDRAQRLDDVALPRARHVLQTLKEAAARGGVAAPEILLARRALEELELDRVEVEAETRRVALAILRHTRQPPAPPSAP